MCVIDESEICQLAKVEFSLEKHNGGTLTISLQSYSESKSPEDILSSSALRVTLEKDSVLNLSGQY